MSHQVDQEFFSKKQVAAYLGVSVRTVERLIAAEKLPFTRVGLNYRFSKMEVDRAAQEGRLAW